MPNSVIFARALLALHDSGVLRDRKCKPAVKIFIRQSSEDAHWNNSTHYRSKSAAAIIKKALIDGKIRSPSQYHAFCKIKQNGLRHEHMVPGEVVYQMIINHPRPSLLAFARILRRTGFRATITEPEDKTLKRDKMPIGFTDKASPLYLDPLGRYREARLIEELEKRCTHRWFE